MSVLGEPDPKYFTTPKPKHIEKRQVSDVLGGNHQRLFKRAIGNLLSTSIAEETYAQIIDGFPLRSVAFDSMSGPWTIYDPVAQHPELCNGVLQKTRSFRDRFDPLRLQLDLKVLQQFQHYKVGSSFSKLPLIELVAVAIHAIAVELIKMDTSLHKGETLIGENPIPEEEDPWAGYDSGSDDDDDDDDDEDEDEDDVVGDGATSRIAPGYPDTVPIPDNLYEAMLRLLYLYRHKRRLMYSPFSVQHYECIEQYPDGVADLAGYWAENRIFGGVVLFQRGSNPLDTPYADESVWFHSDRGQVTTRPYALTYDEKLAFYNFITADPANLPMCPFPILCKDAYRVKVDTHLAIPEYNIYRDRWERRIKYMNRKHRRFDHQYCSMWLDGGIDIEESDGSYRKPFPED